MNHDIGRSGGLILMLLAIRIAGFVFGVVHLHVIVALAFTFTLEIFLLIFVLAALDIDVFTASLRDSVVTCRTSSFVSPSHLCVFALALGGDFLFQLLFVLLLGSILVTVGNKVGLGLVRRELWGSRGFRIP